MSIEIPGELFSQFHSGWKVTFAFVKGAGYRVCIENPIAKRFLSFRLEKEAAQLEGGSTNGPSPAIAYRMIDLARDEALGTAFERIRQRFGLEAR